MDAAGEPGRGAGRRHRLRARRRTDWRPPAAPAAGRGTGGRGPRALCGHRRAARGDGKRH